MTALQPTSLQQTTIQQSMTSPVLTSYPVPSSSTYQSPVIQSVSEVNVTAGSSQVLPSVGTLIQSGAMENDVISSHRSMMSSQVRWCFIPRTYHNQKSSKVKGRDIECGIRHHRPCDGDQTPRGRHRR